MRSTRWLAPGHILFLLRHFLESGFFDILTARTIGLLLGAGLAACRLFHSAPRDGPSRLILPYAPAPPTLAVVSGRGGRRRGPMPAMTVFNLLFLTLPRTHWRTAAASSPA